MDDYLKIIDEEFEREWWHRSNRDRFSAALKELVEVHNVPVDKALDIISNIYCATKDEYGD